MKVSYRGHEIIVERNPSYGGDWFVAPLASAVALVDSSLQAGDHVAHASLSFAVFRESDQYEHLDDGLRWGEF